MQVIASLVEENSIRATVRVTGVVENTIIVMLALPDRGSNLLRSRAILRERLEPLPSRAARGPGGNTWAAHSLANLKRLYLSYRPQRVYNHAVPRRLRHAPTSCSCPRGVVFVRGGPVLPNSITDGF